MTYPKVHFQIKETIVTLSSDLPEGIEIAKSEILKSRLLIENYISKNPFFEVTLESFDLDLTAPPIVQKMIQAGNRFEIGPMSAVAGAIAEDAVLKMKESGAKFAFVDNGGDIAVFNSTEKPITVGVYTGGPHFQTLGFSIEPSDSVYGICASSGTVGHSISFGISDAAVIFSKNVTLADAAATALGNALKEPGKENIEKAFSVLSEISEIDGAVLIEGENIGFYGKIPQMIKTDGKYDMITKG